MVPSIAMLVKVGAGMAMEGTVSGMVTRREKVGMWPDERKGELATLGVGERAVWKEVRTSSVFCPFKSGGLLGAGHRPDAALKAWKTRSMRISFYRCSSWLYLMGRLVGARGSSGVCFADGAVLRARGDTCGQGRPLGSSDGRGNETTTFPLEPSFIYLFP